MTTRFSNSLGIPVVFAIATALCLSTNAIAVDCLGVDVGLIAHYPLDGDAVDATGHGHNGNASGPIATGGHNGSVNSAYYFDGDNDYLAIPYSPALQPSAVTLALWAHRDNWTKASFSGDAALAGNTDGGGYEFYVDRGAGELQAYVRSRSSAYAKPAVSLDELDPGWHHFTLTCDGTDTILYVDGEPVATNSSGDGSVHYTATNSFIVGEEAGAGSVPEGDNFEGKIDEVRIYGRVLCAEEIHELAGSGLVAYYPFNGNANDESGQGNHGTVFGATLTTDRFGNPDGAYSFDGLDDYIDATGAPIQKPAEELTLALWAQNDSWATMTTRGVLTGTTQAGGYNLVANHGGMIRAFVWRRGAYSENLYPLSNLTPGWHHFAVTYDGLTTILYVDGAPRATDVAPFAGPLGYQHANHTLIGAESSAGANPDGDFFTGKIDEVRIYNRALGIEEIDALAGSGGGSNQTGIDYIEPWEKAGKLFEHYPDYKVQPQSDSDEVAHGMVSMMRGPGTIAITRISASTVTNGVQTRSMSQHTRCV